MSPSADPLQLILSTLEVMQGRLTTLENASLNSASSNEVNMVESARPEEEYHLRDRQSSRHLASVSGGDHGCLQELELRGSILHRPL